MCRTTFFLHADDRRSSKTKVCLCPDSRFGRPCRAHIQVERAAPRNMLPPPATPAPIHAPISSYPPTSTYPLRPFSRDSAAAAVSSDGSDHSWSRHSSRRPQRSPGIDVDGQRVHVYSSSGRKRIEMAAQPPTPPMPLQSHLMPRTALPSPHHGAGDASPCRRWRTRVTASSGYFGGWSRHVASDATSYEARENHHISRKKHELRERIEKANEEISNRHERPVKVQQPKPVRRSRRDGFEEVLVGAMGRLSVEDKDWAAREAHQRGLDLEKEEQEAQDRRLKERLVPAVTQP